MEPDVIEGMKLTATILFGLAVLHTFAVKQFNALAKKFRPNSVGENLAHLLGEVEVVFGLWAGFLIAVWSLKYGTKSAAQFLDTVNFTEPLFVFVVMCISATKPIIGACKELINRLAQLIPIAKGPALYIVTLTIGPLLGSAITEPAAMTVTAIILKQYFFTQEASTRLKYATIGLLFVNVSIGGTLTHFAAPPVLMVASAWGWTTPFMFSSFGPQVIVSVGIGAIFTAIVFKNELERINIEPMQSGTTGDASPIWVLMIHLLFLAATVFHSHYASFFVPLFLFFLGWCVVSKEYQEEIKIKESLLVAFFLGGLVTLGKLQDWWLQPLIVNLEPQALFFGAMGLTAFTDNAALTYLGTLVELSDAAKLALVRGAVIGGGLTVIANAPNPAGYNILQDSFGDEGISPLNLFVGALPYTLLATFLFLII